MAKRKFRLPGVQDLSKEQDAALALTKDGQHLIIGGPGTGKSVLCLLRSERHRKKKEDYVFLVYNRTLNQASSQLFGPDLKNEQWQSWFGKLYRSLAKEWVPQLAPDNNGWRDFDWNRILETVSNLEPLPEQYSPCLVIDEGQDMPPQFYQALINLGFENFFVVADVNQKITEQNSNPTSELAPKFLFEPSYDSAENPLKDDRGSPVLEKECANGKKERVINLHTNFRNTYPIARLAREFCTSDPGSSPPDLPEAKPLAKRPMLFEYEDYNFQDLIAFILKYSTLDRRRLIGILAPNNSVRERYYKLLSSVDVHLDGEKPRIQTFKSGEELTLTFDQGGIMVINAQSCKGLEFDTVFLADINAHYFKPEISDQTKRLFYVMVARAIDRVYLLKRSGKHCPVEAILPKNQYILGRAKWK